MSGLPVIAIDGPAAAGKTTVSRLVAERLGYFWFDTGLLYRAATRLAIDRGIDVRDGRALGEALRAANIRVAPPSKADGRPADVQLDDVDVSLRLRGAEVDRFVSVVAAHPEVRAALVDVQRAVARRQPSVMAGRDIGTVIVPDAQLKVFLTATDRERARRRLAEVEPSAAKSDIETALQELRARDTLDSSRDTAPLRKAEDAVEIDSSELSIHEVVDQVVLLARERGMPGAFSASSKRSV